MKANLLQLVDLQNLDSKIFAIKKNLARLPQELEKINAEFSPRMEKFSGDKAQILEKEAQNLNYKMELESSAAKLKELQERLSQVRNARELTAVDKEISAIKASISDTEDANIKLLDELDSLKKETAEEEQIIVKEQQQIDDLKKQIGEEQKKADEELRTLEQDRKKIANTLPESLVSEYEFIFSRREGIAIVAVKNEVCTGCHMSVPPQTVSDIRHGLEIIHCRSCSRMLYYAEWES